MILGPDGTKLSKRHGAVSVLAYREAGYLPEALLNYLARLGWSHGDQEIFSLEEMTALFDIADVNKSASAINPDKLAWINQQHLMRLPPAEVVPELRWQLERLGVRAPDDAMLEAVIVAQRERSKTLKEMAEASRFFFEAPATYEEKAARKNLTPETAAVLEQAKAGLAGIADWAARRHPWRDPGARRVGRVRARQGGSADPRRGRRRQRFAAHRPDARHPRARGNARTNRSCDRLRAA